MKIPVLIMLSFLLMFPANAWTQQVRLYKDIANQAADGVSANNASHWKKGVMTEITGKSVVIDGKEYKLSPHAVIRYPGGKVIKNTETFKAAKSANVSVRIYGRRVAEIVIEGMELRQ